MTQQSPNKQDIDGLVENYVTHIVDGMDVSDLEQMCYDLLTREYEKLSWDDITEEIVDLYDEDTLIELLPDAQWESHFLPSWYFSALWLVSTLSTLFQTFKMQNNNASANQSRKVQDTMKSAGTSADIVRKYKHVDSDGDWDDIMSPDDYDDYIDARRYERSMRGYWYNAPYFANSGYTN